MSDIFEKIYADYGSINNDYNISNYNAIYIVINIHT